MPGKIHQIHQIHQGLYGNGHGAVTVLVLALTLCLCGGFALAQSDDTPAAGTPVSGADRMFTHPSLGFRILVPGNASLTRGEAPVVASIRSRAGWGVNIQAAAHNPQSSVEDMIARLESRYLGTGKAWEKKLLGRGVSAFDRPGYEGVYAGSGMKVRLMLLRTGTYDYVMLFISPAGTFEVSSAVFDRILMSFRPSGLSADDVSVDNRRVEGQSAEPTEPAKPATGEGGHGMQRFHDGKLGYSMMYPRRWQISRPNPSTAVFGGETGTEEAFTTISVQNVAPPMSGSDRMIVDMVVQELQAQMAHSVSDIHHTPGKPFMLGTTGNPVEVSQFLSDYRMGGTAFRQWTLAMPRPGEGIIHVWTYSAPLDRFSRYQGIAQQMAGSLTIEPVMP